MPGGRLGAAACVLLLGALAWWVARPHGARDEGLVVEVRALDAGGAPLAGAQVERVFEGRSEDLGPGGVRRLARLVLRSLDEPSPASIARALSLRAPFHALRRAGDLRVERRPDGTWLYEARLQGHGVLRLFVDYTHVGGAKAYPTALQEGAVEPVGGVQVARHGSPASYRVFPGPADVEVRLEGLTDHDGAVGVATRRYRLAAPAVGHVEEHVLVPEAVQPLVGRVEPGDGPRPPSLGGRVRVVQVEDDGTRSPLAEIPVQPDGSFVARLTGPGRYELEATLDFFPGTTRVTVPGGAVFDLAPAGPASWAEVAHAGLDLRGRPAVFTLRADDGGEAAPTAALPGEGRSSVALPAGRWHLLLSAAGTQSEPPWSGSCEVASQGAGEVACALDLQRLPDGELVVLVPRAAFGRARGATVRVGARAATAIPGLAERLRFPHLVPGDQQVRVEWDDAERAPTMLTAQVVEARSTTVSVPDASP